MKRSGRKSLSQTKALLKEQIKGSKANPKGSASSKSKASKIKLSEKIMDILKKKKEKYNKSHTKDVDTNSLKAVMRRGMGAYSTSHRPGMTRQGWGFARVNKFLLKKGGAKVKAAYVQDDDLLEKGGELNPDDPKLKNTMIHKSGSAGGVLVGKRHSEGGIKAVNKSSDSPLEMEGGEVVITRNAVSDDEKREFEGKMMTNREILSKINEDGGGVAFANGGKVEKEADCGCDDTMEDGGDTNSKIYKGFEIGSDGTYKIPNIKNFGIKHHDLPPSEAFKKLYSHKFEDGGEVYKDGGLIQIIDKQVPSMVAFENAFKHVNFHSVKNAYKQHLQKMYNVTFTELPHRIQMALLLGNQKLVDKFINE